MFSSFTDTLEVDMESLLSSTSSRFGYNQEEEEQELCSIFPSLTWQQRVGGCIGCMVLGYVLSFGSFMRMRDLIVYGDPLPFVTIATLGNVISLCGSCFLMGPTSQSKKMFHPTRRIATILYLSSLILTLVVAFALLGWKGQSLLLVVLMICQYVAIAWYCMSYVPFARQLATRLCSRLYSEVVDMD